jgi:hypothetical protein
MGKFSVCVCNGFSGALTAGIGATSCQSYCSEEASSTIGQLGIYGCNPLVSNLRSRNIEKLSAVIPDRPCYQGEEGGGSPG